MRQLVYAHHTEIAEKRTKCIKCKSFIRPRKLMVRVLFTGAGEFKKYYCIKCAFKMRNTENEPLFTYLIDTRSWVYKVDAIYNKKHPIKPPTLGQVYYIFYGIKNQKKWARQKEKEYLRRQKEAKKENYGL